MAVGVVLTLEHLDWYPPDDVVVPARLRGGRGTWPKIPDVHQISPVDYGNRVGVFRVQAALDRCGIRPTVAMDTAVMRRAPFLVDHLLGRGAEFVGHGCSSEQTVSSAMAEADEREIISRTRAEITAVTGQHPRGWHGVDYSESQRSVALLAEHGFDYVLDWPTDEQPHAMQVPSGSMTNLPMTVELDDVVTQVDRRMPVARYADMIRDQFDRLHDDAASSGRVFVLNLHPWVSGQPFRIRHIEAALTHIAGREDVWLATCAEIVDAYRLAATAR